jgi:hypothetical protein
MNAQEIISKLRWEHELSYFQETLKDVFDNEDYLGEEFSYATIAALNYWREDYISDVLSKEFGNISVVESQLRHDDYAIIVLQFEGDIFIRIDFTISSYEQPYIHSITQVKPVQKTITVYENF